MAELGSYEICGEPSPWKQSQQGSVCVLPKHHTVDAHVYSPPGGEVAYIMRLAFTELVDLAKDENERLRAELDEWREAATKSYGERCGTDEQHCACVPLLRVEIERLRAESEVYLARVTKLNGELYDAHIVIDTFKQQRA